MGAPGASSSSAAPLLATVSGGGGAWWAEATVAGVVPAPPDAVYPILSDPTRAGRDVFSDVRLARELRRTPQWEDASGALCQQVDVEQVARVWVLGLPVDAAMTVRLDCDHSAKQVRLRMLRGNMLVRRYEGVYAVLPCSADPAHPPALPEGLAEALGPEAARQLTTALGQHQRQQQYHHYHHHHHQQQQQQCSLQAAKQRSGGHHQGKPTHSLVVFHQRLQPAVQPPPGLGGYVRGQVLRQFEQMFADLHRAACTAAPRPALHGSADWPRSHPLRSLSLSELMLDC